MLVVLLHSTAEKRRTYDLYGEEGLRAPSGSGHRSRGRHSSTGTQTEFQGGFGDDMFFHDPFELFNRFFGSRSPFACAIEGSVLHALAMTEGVAL